MSTEPQTPTPFEGQPPAAAANASATAPPAPSAAAAAAAAPGRAGPAASASPHAPTMAAAQAASPTVSRGLLALGAVAALIAVVAIGLAWSSQQRLKLLEQQLVARQQQAQTESGEALVLARQSQDAARESAARMALLEARVAEAAVQRSQLDELIQSLSRSRDENLLADIEAALRMSQQQAALTGSLEPLVAALRQADERLARHNQPRLERVRRAVLRDLERVRGASQVDVATLVIRLDEVARQVDDLPLTAMAKALGAASSAGSQSSEQPPTNPSRPDAAGAPLDASSRAPSRESGRASSPEQSPATPASPAPASNKPETSPAWQESLARAAQVGVQGLAAVWNEMRSLVRITRIDNPEAVLTAPEQQFFLRENLKLRLLNARLALLSRQFDVAQSDLRDAQRTIERYFDPSSRRVGAAVDQVRQLGLLSRQVSVPRPDETLAALASVNTLR